jgi:hypothetical protein
LLITPIEYEKEVRKQKIRQELSQSKREYDFISEKQSLAETIRNIEERRVGILGLMPMHFDLTNWAGKEE